MENILQAIIDSFTGQGIVSIFFKLFALTLGLLFVLYAIILYRQIVIMNRALTTQAASILQLIGLIQILGALILFLLAIVLI